GCHLVPRWRTRMLPASTASPPNFLMPRRLPSVSRPLRDEPPAFLCAMADYSCGAAGAAGEAGQVCPLALMPATRSTVTCWRWPLRRRLFCRRRFLKMMTLSSRSCAITVAVTEASATVGAPRVRLPSLPTASTSVKVTVPPGSASSFSTFSTAFGVTRYCFPPVRMTANMTFDFPRQRNGKQGAHRKGPRNGTRRPEGAVIASGLAVSTRDMAAAPMELGNPHPSRARSFSSGTNKGGKCAGYVCHSCFVQAPDPAAGLGPGDGGRLIHYHLRP